MANEIDFLTQQLICYLHDHETLVHFGFQVSVKATVGEEGDEFRECHPAYGESYLLLWFSSVIGLGIKVYLETLSVLKNNTMLKESLVARAMPVVKFKKVVVRKGTKEELTLEAKFLMPPELKENHITQYPLVLET